MEAMRRKLMENAGTSMYPDVSRVREAPGTTSQAQNPISVVSINSDASDSDMPVKMKPRNQNPIIVLSDSEDDEVQIVSQPLRPQSSNAPPPAPLKAARPVHIPSNKDLEPLRTSDRDYETFDLPAADNMYDPMLTPADAEKALQDLVTGAYGHDEVDVSLEDAIVEGFRPEIKLLPHQIVGRKWMAERETGKKTGGLLADDMGLGKTIQTITRIVDGRATKRDKKDGWSPSTLVVCPVAVVSQWASEIKKMAIGLTVIEHHGQTRTSNPSDLERAHVVITSYSTIASEYGTYSPATDESKPKKKSKQSQSQVSDDSDDDSVGKVLKTTTRKASGKKPKDALFRVKWYRIVLDEAHNIKNRTTKAALACCALESKYRWCLTGTPMQNNVEELFSLFKFLRIRPLNDWPTFNAQIALPVKSNKTTRAMKRLQVVLGAVMLRRTKETVVNGKPILQLPDRSVGMVECHFDAQERAFYETVNTRVQDSLDKLEKQGGVAKNYTSMLVLLLRLRQACNHPTLVSEDYRKDKDAVEPKAAQSREDGDEDADALADALAGMGISGTTSCQLCQMRFPVGDIDGDGNCNACASLMTKARRRSTDSDLPPDSSKTRKILELLHDIDKQSGGQEKTIIFSQFTSMLDLLEPFLLAEGIKFVRYDGSMNKLQRDQALEKIRESRKTRVILISFKAGSTGLNLTCCNNVILVDLWWNPALEDQAFDRAHRFGQTRNVRIHKLFVPNTVEDKILELQDKKRELAKAALSGDRMKNMRLGADELVALFRHGGNDEDDDD